MSEIVVSRIIETTPERVWEVLTDLDRAPETLTGVTDVQRLTDGPYAVGTRWRETRTMFGKKSTEEMWVTASDPWRRSEIHAESSGAHYVTEFLLAPLDDGARTELTVRFAAEPVGPSAVQKALMAVLGGVATRATRKALEQDLADIAAAAEA
ncbi:SRPBCC family protein [Ornithinimicrobium cavernae]|uniref:SRPBCC family protein n=1 Tax=Ornithinimicrobium cavernae TaxID=2666047 RepID=UPI000D68C2B7|nr:SRPBCC family protein [Ornithinimicrobium cavernae]